MNPFFLFTFAFTNFQTTDSKFCFHDSIEKSNSVIVKNFKEKNFDRNRKYNIIQLCTENKTTEISLNESFDDVFAHINVKNNITKNSSNFVCSTDDIKIIDHDVNLMSILNQCASIKNSDMNDMTNITSKSIKNTVNDLNYMQLNNRNTNFTTTLT